MFRAVLSNPLHPEHGQATVPFPLREDVYPQTLELLRTLDLGNPTGRDCQIDEISGGYSVLKRLEGGMSNLDELDYLAKRLESFDDDQGIQFEAVAAARDISSIEDFINLPFCCDRVTVIYDFSDLEAVGRRHYLNTHGGCASAEESLPVCGRLLCQFFHCFPLRKRDAAGAALPGRTLSGLPGSALRAGTDSLASPGTN